jgi:REP element-mobilizing transposase RayT
MPSHLYWIVITDKTFGTISDRMRDIKKYSAWDILDGIMKNDKDLMSVFIEAGKKYPNHKRKFWMKRFDDEVIRNEKMYWTKLHYIHNNRVEAGLVNKPECYKFSSAQNYVYTDNSTLEMDIAYAGIEIK